MIINRLEYCNFRNLKSGCIYPCDGMNIITGENGQGKTNLLECIWMFNGVKSFRGSKDRELVAFGESFAWAELGFFAQDREQSARLEFKNGKREAFLNEIKKPAPSHLMGKLTSVIFSPVHLSLVKDGPGVRRKFTDSAICQVKPKYSVYLARYNRILSQRNALLKEFSAYSDPYAAIEVWDRELAVNGAVIINERIKYLSRLSDTACEYHSGISDNREKLEIVYRKKYTSETTVSEISQELFEQLNQSLKEDLQLKYTTKGPHRDDLEIYINGKSARQYASQGQQRSAVLSMKLAEATLAELITGTKPVILLDDVMSELDSVRKNFLLNELDKKQVFITCCDESSVSALAEGKVFAVRSGEVSEKQ